MKHTEIVCSNCKTINEIEIDLPRDRVVLGLTKECDGCGLDIVYDLEVDVRLSPG